MKRVFCVMEGGGAKGLAHVGALAALEDAEAEGEIVIAGYAGTSAGAIAATLSCVGYSAKEMFDASAKTSILDLIDLDPEGVELKPLRPAKSPSDLFGSGGWRAIRLMRDLIDGKSKLPYVAVVVCLVLLAILRFADLATAIAVLVGIGQWIAINTVKLERGFVSLDMMSSAMNQLIGLKLRGDRRAQALTFADLASAGCKPLRIVASDVTSKSLKLFSVETSPDASVADAVAASACLPIVFSAVEIDGAKFLDGGLVSNLPAWAFDEERVSDRDALTAAIEFTAPAGSEPKNYPLLIATLETAISGSHELNKRAVDRLAAVEIGVDAEMLDFDVSFVKAAQVIEVAKALCELELVFPLIRVPTLMEQACAELATNIIEVIGQARSQVDLAPYAGRVRVAFAAQPVEGSRVLRYEFSHGYDDDADERLTFPINGSPAGSAWLANQPMYSDSSDAEWGSHFGRSEERWLRKLDWKSRAWSLCVPTTIEPFDKSLVVCVDGDEPLGFDEADLDQLLNTLNAIILQA